MMFGELTHVRVLAQQRDHTRCALPEAIREARRAGATLGQLSLATGLTKQRISQITKEA